MTNHGIGSNFEGAASTLVVDSADAVESSHRGAVRGPSFQWSDIWKSPLHDLPMRDEILYQYLPLSPEMEILEMGPGSGFTAFRLSRQVRRLTLLDIARGTVEKLSKSLDGLINLSFICADSCAQDLPDQVGRRFDAAYALDMFEFVPDPAKALKNLAGLLKPGGRLLLTWPNYPPERSKGVCHIRSMAELEELLRQAGFENWEIYTLRLRPYARLLYRILHEKPRRLYQRLRGHRETQDAQVYDQTWSYQHGRKIEPLRYALHTAWTLFFAAIRLGGACFERVPISGDNADGNLLLLARVP